MTAMEFDRSLEQRREALKKANAVRAFKVERKRAIREAEDPYWLVAQMLREPEGAELSLTLKELVTSIPKVGMRRLSVICRRLNVGMDSRLRMLTPRQRGVVADAIEEIGKARGF